MPSDDERSTLLGSTPTEKTQQREAKKSSARPAPRKATRFAPLESVSESTEELQSSSSPPTRRHQEYFGVRSYVHTFYEAMAMEEPGKRGRRGKGRRDCRRRLWRCAYAAGALLLLAGLCVLLVGHLVAKRREVVDVQEDIEVVSRAGLAFNRRLDACKIAGLGLFCAGGALTAAALVALAFCDRPEEEEGEGEGVVATGGPDPGPRPLAVPVTEEVRAVQPGRKYAEGCACKGRT